LGGPTSQHSQLNDTAASVRQNRPSPVSPGFTRYSSEGFYFQKEKAQIFAPKYWGLKVCVEVAKVDSSSHERALLAVYQGGSGLSH
jgi:hypothetical protein